MNCRAFAVVAAACIWTGAASAQTSPHRVKVQSGVLEGAVSGAVASFKAIPYAAPPVGEFRWRAPQPPVAWAGIRAASDYGPACIQTAGASGYRGAQSEDCLTLNVWVPAAGTAKKPVMVWLHGGGFAYGDRKSVV